MKLGGHVRLGLLGAMAGLAIGIIAIHHERNILVHSADPFLRTRERAFQLTGSLDDHSPDLENRSSVLEYIAIIRFFSGDKTGALETMVRIENVDVRDTALNHLFTHVTNSDSVPHSRILADAASDLTPVNVVPGSSDVPFVVDEKARRRKIILQAVGDARNIISAIQNPGRRALSWSRVGQLQSLDLEDQKGAQESFRRAVEEAERIVTKPKETLAPMHESPAGSPDSLPNRRGMSDSTEGWMATILSYLRIRILYVWIFAVFIIGTFIAEVIKQFAAPVARAFGSDKTEGAVSRFAATLSRRLKTRRKDRGPNENATDSGLSDDKAVGRS